MTTKALSVSRLLVVASVACIGLVASQAGAANGSFSGAECDGEGPAGPPTYSLGLQKDSNAILNTSGSTIDVVCPIRRVNTTTTNGFSDFQVFVADNSPSKTLFCSLSSEDTSGNVLAAKNAYYDSSHPGKLTFTSMLNTSSSGGGPYSLWCQIPNSSPQSGVSSYYWVEN